jgi:hypothetical protein
VIRQLIVVQREDLGLYHALRADWAGDERIAVILDRRLGQRRRDVLPASIERRNADRRQHRPLEAVLAWRGGGSAARKSDVLSVLTGGVGSITVRQRPATRAEPRTTLRSSHDRRGRVAREAMIAASTSAAVALVVALGTLSGGVFGGAALWLFMTHEFATSGSRSTNARLLIPAGAARPTWYRRPLQRLLRAYRATAASRHRNSA